MFTLEQSSQEESDVSMEIKAMAEVEKIWIMYDLDDNGSLDFDETKAYLKEMAYPNLSISAQKLEKIF